MLFMAGGWGSAMCTSIKTTCECVSTLAGGGEGGESQFTQQALRKHFSCHDSITTLTWRGDGEGLGVKMEERTERQSVVKETSSSFQLNRI